MTFTIRPSVLGDAEILAPILRKEDVDEVLAAGSDSPLDALQKGYLLSSLCLTACENKRPRLMMGVVPSPNPETGYIWLLSSDLITRHPITFLRRSKDWLTIFHTLFPHLTNAADMRNEVHLRWLEWMGFSFTNIIEGPYPFIQFERFERV